MSNGVISVTVSLLILAILPMVSINAQPLSPIDNPVSVSVGPMGGVTSPQGDFGDFYNSGYHVGGLLWLSIGPFGARAEGNYHKMETPGSAFGTPLIDGEAKLTGFLLSGTYVVLPTPLINPYIIVGGGSYKLETEVSNEVNAPADVSESTGFALAGGVGAKLQLRKIGVFLEGRYVRVSTEGDAAKFILVSGGLMFAVL